MASNIRINNHVKDIFRILKADYIGVRQVGEYGPSAFQYFLWQINDIILDLPTSTHRVSKDGKYRYKARLWGTFIYDLKKVHSNNVYIITDFILDKVNFYNWIYYHQYPTKSNIPKPERWFKKKIESIFNKYHIIKIYSKEKYNLIDNNGKIILSEWVSKIKPVKSKEPVGKLKVIAYCNCRGFVSVVTIDGIFYVTENSWNDRFAESMNNNELMSAINEICLNINSQIIIERYEDVLRSLIY